MIGVLAGALVLPLALGAQVAINEIMYHPVEEPAFNPDGTPVVELYDDVHEFVELHNVSGTEVRLGGWKLTGGIEFTFPQEAVIAADGFLIVAKDPARLAKVNAYQLTPGTLYGPFAGQLSNGRDTIKLRDGAGEVVDSVSYSAGFPWPIGADALGADQEWTGLDPKGYQYRGRSLERVSASWSGNDPANWLASPLRGNPSPGQPNSVRRAVPKPVVVKGSHSSTIQAAPPVRNSGPMRIECRFSHTNNLRDVTLEYFVDNINSTTEVPISQPMTVEGDAQEGRFVAVIPTKPFRSIVRYRIRADRGDGSEVVSPRADDPLGWHAYFVAPARTSGNRSYELFISTRSWTKLIQNIEQEPRRTTMPDPPGRPRASWNATEPAVFASDGEVWDVQMRHHGSRYHRQVDRRSFKLKFPRYHRFEDQDAVFLTDKDEATVAGHAMFRAAGLPNSRTRWVDLYMNSDLKRVRLEEEECNEDLLEKFYRARHELDPSQPLELPGDLFKAQGFDGGGSEGPYGRIDGRQLEPLPPHWTDLQRYEWNYNSQNHPWRGHSHVKELIDAMWATRGDTPDSVNPDPDLAALRSYVERYWDVDDLLTYLATYTWMGVWDDVFHNYFLWQKRSGKWAMLPWDFDAMFSAGGPDGPGTASIFSGEVGVEDNSFWGPSYFKDTFFKAYREEYKQRLFLLNNTVFHPEHFTELGLGSFREFAAGRFKSINQQCGLGVFQRPERPVNLAPANGQSILPAASLNASAFQFRGAPVPQHASTTWLIRAATGKYTEPVFQLTTRDHLTELPVPFEKLEFGRTYFWKCTYTDANGHPSLASDETSFRYGDTPVANSAVVLNEIMAANDSAVANDSHYPDWIELHNRSPLAVSLAGLSLSDDLLVPKKFIFPAGTTLEPLGFLVVWCDTRMNSPGLHTGFALDDGGQAVVLIDYSEGQAKLLDQITFGLQVTDLSVGRTNDSYGEWTLTLPTPGQPNQPISLSSPANLKINEWMASPSTGDDWFELCNPDPAPVALGGIYVTDDLDHPLNSQIPALSFIGANGFVKFIADEHPERGARHVKFKLSANGESLGLFLGETLPVDSVTFKAQLPGVSEGRLPDGTNAVTRFSDSASPSDSNYLPITNVVINEVLSHSAPPMQDAIELHNPAAQPVDLSGWFLSDQLSELKKFRIPDGTRLAAGGFVVFYEYQFNRGPLNSTSFALNSARGDQLYLSAADAAGNLTGHRTGVKFGAAETGVSFGRFRTSVGVDFVPLAARTFGADTARSGQEFISGKGQPNAGPKIGPVVLSELMFHPPDLVQGTDSLDNVAEEFIELHNLTSRAVPLYDPLRPANSWRLRDGVECDLPPFVTLAPHGYLLVVSFDPVKDLGALATFHSKYPLPPGTQLVGPYEGRLDNGGDAVGLYRPDAPQIEPDPDAGYVPYPVVDKVRYGDASPWPFGADGSGASLQRLYAGDYGNDPVNWFAGPPTPGANHVLDSDDDGMSDDWELANGLDRLAAGDALLDSDGDGHTNRDEFRLGTDPRNSSSSLLLEVVRTPSATGDVVVLAFIAMPGRSYTVLVRDSLATGEWTTSQDVEPSPVATTVEAVDRVGPATGPRFYRVVSPRLP